jgi:hypothetical protein
MAKKALAQVLNTVERLDPDELREVERAVQERLGLVRFAPEEEEFLESLVASGLIQEIRRPRASSTQRRLIYATGEPVSETIIRERR